MQDALEGLEELANIAYCGTDTSTFEILAIEVPASDSTGEPPSSTQQQVNIIPFPNRDAA